MDAELQWGRSGKLRKNDPERKRRVAQNKLQWGRSGKLRKTLDKSFENVAELELQWGRSGKLRKNGGKWMTLFQRFPASMGPERKAPENAKHRKQHNCQYY